MEPSAHKSCDRKINNSIVTETQSGERVSEGNALWCSEEIERDKKNCIVLQITLKLIYFVLSTHSLDHIPPLYGSSSSKLHILCIQYIPYKYNEQLPTS